MQHFFTDETALKALIQAVPANHSLRTAGAECRDAFASAFLAVYGNMADRAALAVLKRKFLVSADSAFLEDTYEPGTRLGGVANAFIAVDNGQTQMHE